VLLLEPTIQFHKREEQRTSIWQFFELLKPHGKIVFQIFLTSLLIQVFSLATPILTQLLLDKVVVQGSTITLNAVGTGLLIFGIFRVIATGLQQYLLAYIANKIDLKLIVGFIHHTLRLPLSFFESRDVGEIQTRVQENSKIRNFLTGESLSIILQLLTVFVSVPLMFWYNWKLALLILAVIPAFLFLTLIATPFLRRISREIFNANAEQNNNLIDTLKGISSVKAMATEPTAQSRWEESFNRFIRRNFSGQIIGNRFSIINSGIQTFAKVGLLWFGGWLVIKGQLTIGQLVAFNMLLDRVLQPFQQLSGLWTKLQEVLISVERINDVLEAEPEEDLERHSRQPLTKLDGQIRFEQVTFRYHAANNSNVLEDINLEIEPGQKIAIVGRSGSGKTTLSKLILGMYSPTEGRILIDDQDINFLSLRTLREHIGVVDQDSCLFRGTIQDNLSFRSPDARFEQIQEAAKQAGAHEFIQELPYGYQTNIGEGGSLLSGGQRQRLVIAMALMNNPSLLIFDEATSHLDAESERVIQNNFNYILRDRTAIIIAHRLSTIRKADRILVLDQGKVVESGTHKELMNKQGHYFALYQQQ